MVLERFLRHKVAVAGALLLVAISLIVFSTPLYLTADDYLRTNPEKILQPPSSEHPLGTDTVGRDVLGRIVVGGSISLRVGLLAALVAVSVGTLLGAAAAYWGGSVDVIISRIIDALLAIPKLFLMIVLAKVFGQTVLSITLIIGLLNWMVVARIVRGNVLSIKEQEYVQAAHAMGLFNYQILIRYLLPNTMGPIIVAATLGFGHAILLEASASFLGLGIQPPTPSWGSMLYRAKSVLGSAPWLAWFPGLAILITILCLNFIGDGLRDAFDPRSNRRV